MNLRRFHSQSFSLIKKFFCHNIHKINSLIEVRNLQPFKRAWRAACGFKGRSRLLIPGGAFLLSQIVFAGPCSGPSPTIVQVMGTLKATTDIREYSSSEWVLFQSINGLVITGSGTFDGQGGAAWKYNDCKSNKRHCVQLPSVS